MQDQDFKIFLEKLKVPLKGIIKRINGHHQELDDDDLFQEASIHLWHRFSRNDFLDKNNSYILKSCYFHLKNYLRHKSFSYNLTSLDEKTPDGSGTLQDFLTKDEYLPEPDQEARFLIEDIKSCNLTPREEDALKFYLEDLTTREIASRLGVSHVRVVKLMASIKARYKKWSLIGKPSLRHPPKSSIVSLADVGG